MFLWVMFVSNPPSQESEQRPSRQKLSEVWKSTRMAGEKATQGGIALATGQAGP